MTEFSETAPKPTRIRAAWPEGPAPSTWFRIVREVAGFGRVQTTMTITKPVQSGPQFQQKWIENGQRQFEMERLKRSCRQFEIAGHRTHCLSLEFGPQRPRSREASEDLTFRE